MFLSSFHKYLNQMTTHVKSYKCLGFKNTILYIFDIQLIEIFIHKGAKIQKNIIK